MTAQIPDLKDKINTSIAYLTLGIWGLIYLLISRRNYFDQKDFIRFHAYQSIFIGMFYFFIPQGLSILFSLIIQIINLIPATTFITNQLHVIHGLVQTGFHYGSLALILYCIVFCLYGKYTNIPWISQMINRMLR